MGRHRLLAALGVLIFVVLALACGPSAIRVVGVMRQSTQMRPLAAVPLGGYQQLHILVRAAADPGTGRDGSFDCGFTKLEGAEEGVRNAACLPVETLNKAVGIVRQRLRSYGVQVVRDASDPFDYTLDVVVTGLAPKRADPRLVKALAQVTLRREPKAAAGTFAGSIDWAAAASAFDSIAKNCALDRSDDRSSVSASSTEPMIPDFDVEALATGAVDNLLRCYDLANFFLEARTRYPKTGAAPPAPAQ